MSQSPKLKTQFLGEVPSLPGASARGLPRGKPTGEHTWLPSEYQGLWGLARASSPTSLPPAHSCFANPPQSEEAGKQLVFMNRNSIRQRFLGAGRGRERGGAHKRAALLPPAGRELLLSPSTGRSRLYCVNPFACQELLCAFSPPVRCGRGRRAALLAGHLCGRRPPP